MKNRFLFLFIYSFFLKDVKAQWIDPSGFIVSSQSKSVDNDAFDWNLGESILVNTLYASSNLIISSGILQTTISGTYYFHYIDSVGIKITIGPNPVKNTLTITAAQEGLQIEKIQIVDAWGRKIFFEAGPFSGLNFKKYVSFSSVNTGVYFVIVYYVVANTMQKNKIFKIVKI